MSFVERIMSNKPLLIGGGVVLVGIVLLSASKGSATGSTAVVQTGPTDAQIAAARDIQIAGIQSSAQVTAINAQLAAQQQTDQTELAKTQLQVQLSQYAIDAENARAAAEAKMAYALQTQQTISAQEQADRLADLQAGVAKYTLDQAYATQVANNNFQLDYAEQSNLTTVATTKILADLTARQIDSNAAVTMTQMQTNRDVTLGVLQSQYNLEQAKIGAETSVALANIASYDKATAAAYNYKASLAEATFGSLGSLKKNNRDDVIETLITGEMKQPSNSTSKTAQIIGSVGSAAGNIAKLFL